MIEVDNNVLSNIVRREIRVTVIDDNTKVPITTVLTIPAYYEDKTWKFYHNECNM